MTSSAASFRKLPSRSHSAKHHGTDYGAGKLNFLIIPTFRKPAPEAGQQSACGALGLPGETITAKRCLQIHLDQLRSRYGGGFKLFMPLKALRHDGKGKSHCHLPAQGRRDLSLAFATRPKDALTTLTFVDAQTSNHSRLLRHSRNPSWSQQDGP